MKVIIETKCGTEDEWKEANPVLSKGERGLVTDLECEVIGDGVQRYASLTKYKLTSKEMIEALNSNTAAIALNAEAIARNTAKRSYPIEEEQKLRNLEENQTTGVQVYATLSALPSPGVLKVSYKVSNDPEKSKNGFYHWDGTTYQKDLDLITGEIAAGNVEAVTGAKIHAKLLNEAEVLRSIEVSSNVYPKTQTVVAVNNDTILKKDGGTQEQAGFHTTNFLERLTGNGFNYYRARFNPNMSSFFAHVAYYDSDENFIKSFVFTGNKVIALRRGLKMKISTNNTYDITQLTSIEIKDGAPIVEDLFKKLDLLNDSLKVGSGLFVDVFNEEHPLIDSLHLNYLGDTQSITPNFKTTDYIQHTGPSGYRYVHAIFNATVSTHFFNLCLYDSDNNFLKGMRLEGAQIIPIPPTYKIRLTTTGSHKVHDVSVVSTQTSSPLNTSKKWIDYSLGYNLTTENTKTGINAIKAINIVTSESKKDVNIRFNTLCTTPTTLPAANYGYSVGLKNTTDNQFLNLVRPKNAPDIPVGIETLTYNFTNGADFIDITLVIDWSLLPDPFEMYNTQAVYIKKNLFDVEAVQSRAIYELQRQLTLSGGKKVLWIGTSIPQSAQYPYVSCQNLGYECFNKALGSSGIVITDGWANNTGRDGKDLTETVLDKEVRYRPYVQSGEITEADLDRYKGYSFENLIIPYIDGTLANVDVIVFDHGYNDGGFIRNEIPTIESNSWEPDDTADRTTWVGAFRYLLSKIYQVKPTQKIVLVGFLEGESDETGRGGKYLKQMHEYMSKVYGFPLLKTYEHTGFNFLHIPGTSNYISDFNTQYGTNYYSRWPDAEGNITAFQLYCPDGVHPHSDKTGRSNIRLNAIFTKMLRDIV